MIEKRADYDPGRLLTWAAIWFVLILILFVCTIIGVQIWRSGEANTESWAALTGIIGWATAQAQVLYSNRFGSTLSNTKKDAAITRIAEQSAPVSAAAVAANIAAAAGTPPIPVVQPMNPGTEAPKP